VQGRKVIVFFSKAGRRERGGKRKKEKLRGGGGKPVEPHLLNSFLCAGAQERKLGKLPAVWKEGSARCCSKLPRPKKKKRKGGGGGGKKATSSTRPKRGRGKKRRLSKKKKVAASFYILLTSLYHYDGPRKKKKKKLSRTVDLWLFPLFLFWRGGEKGVGKGRELCLSLGAGGLAAPLETGGGKKKKEKKKAGIALSNQVASPWGCAQKKKRKKEAGRYDVLVLSTIPRATLTGEESEKGTKKRKKRRVGKGRQ